MMPRCYDGPGDLENELVAFSQQPRYDRVASIFLDEYGYGLEDADEQRWMLLRDCFVLEHRLANGRTVVEQFVDARPDLPEAERAMVLGWRDVVQGPFELSRGGAMASGSQLDRGDHGMPGSIRPANAGKRSARQRIAKDEGAAVRTVQTQGPCVLRPSTLPPPGLDKRVVLLGTVGRLPTTSGGSVV